MTATCTVTVTDENVYVAGYKANDPGFYVATLWTNGVPQALSDGTTDAKAYAVYVSDTDVYVAGYEDGKAKLWKNGVSQTLPNNNNANNYINSLFVKDNDVYVVGSQVINNEDKAMLWKSINGADFQSDVIINESLKSTANSVYVSDAGVVYIAVTTFGAENSGAVLWVDGELTFLGDFNSYNNANSVYVSGNDVYVAGKKDSKATLWKNGVAQQLSENGTAYSVFISGNDVYVAGYEDSAAALWKNGVVQELGEDGEVAYSVYVSGDDVYVAGYQYDNDINLNKPILWKNGVAQKLSNNVYGSEKAYSVFVK
tara:strand:- start:6815 stop:7753 length:939 start_codon:yes stop_codon:yes gene_type:complete